MKHHPLTFEIYRIIMEWIEKGDKTPYLDIPIMETDFAEYEKEQFNPFMPVYQRTLRFERTTRTYLGKMEEGVVFRGKKTNYFIWYNRHWRDFLAIEDILEAK